jgi:hypothetical protein
MTLPGRLLAGESHPSEQTGAPFHDPDPTPTT